MVLRFLPVLWTCWRGPDRVFMGLRTGPGRGAPHARERDACRRGICCPKFARQYSQKTATRNSYIWGGNHGFEVFTSTLNLLVQPSVRSSVRLLYPGLWVV